jgi:hypothetical protein
MSSSTLTRLSGCLAVFTLCLTGLFLIDGLAESVHDRWGTSGYEPPHLLAGILLFAPFGTWTALLQSASLAGLYWLLTERQAPPSYHLVWHALALGGASILWALGVFVHAEMTYLNGNRPITTARVVANGLLTAALVASVVLAYSRRPRQRP